MAIGVSTPNVLCGRCSEFKGAWHTAVTCREIKIARREARALSERVTAPRELRPGESWTQYRAERHALEDSYGVATVRLTAALAVRYRLAP